MKEITVKGCDLGLKIFINEEPDLSKLSDEELDVLATVLEILISKQYENYMKRKKYDKKSA